MKCFHKVLKQFIAELFDSQITGSAAELSYYCLFSVFPLITITGMISYGGSGTQSAFVNFVSRFTPDIVIELFDNYFAYASVDNKATFFSLGIIVSLYAIARYINRLKRKIREIYREFSHVGFIKEWILSFVYSVLLAFAFYFTLVVQSVGEKVLDFAARALTVSGYEKFDHVYSLRYVAVFVYVFLLLITAYRYIPINNTEFAEAAPGAFISTAAWLFVCYIFSEYVDNFSHYSSSYGQLAAFLVLMVWIFIINNIILAGAVINNFFANKQKST